MDLNKVAQSVGTNLGVPPRSTCVFCHSRAGGDDNVKHGDISTDMTATTRQYDVHMGTDGGNFTCVKCHQVKKDTAGNTLSHGIGGMAFHSIDEGVMKECSDCHGAVTSIHAGTSVESLVQTHSRLACQVCHIPTIARKVSTDGRLALGAGRPGRRAWYLRTRGRSGGPAGPSDLQQAEGLLHAGRTTCGRRCATSTASGTA